MKNKLIFWVLVILTILVISGCSNDNTTGQIDSSKPQPQVRIQTKPSATILVPTEISTPPASEISATSTAAPIYYDPTPDSDSIANQIESMMDEIDRKLKSENFLLK